VTNTRLAAYHSRAPQERRTCDIDAKVLKSLESPSKGV
jgi:hypothetical protein